MFIKRSEYERMKARNAYLENELVRYREKEAAKYKEMNDLQYNEAMKKREKEEKQKAKNIYCAACKYSMLNPFSLEKPKEPVVLCSLNGKKVCENFQHRNFAGETIT